MTSKTFEAYVFAQKYIDRFSGKNNIVFGSIGVMSFQKNSHWFFILASQIFKNKFKLKPVFNVIGPAIDNVVNDYSHKLNGVNILSNDNKVPLSEHEMSNAINGLDYSVFVYGSDSYRLKMSGAVLDSFSFLKPVIAIKNPMFMFLFEKMGDIGYLCNDLDELKDVIIDLLNNFDTKRYWQQQENILKNRNIFSIENAAKLLKE